MGDWAGLSEIEAHVRPASGAAPSRCRSWWSAFTHASADFQHAPEGPPSCRDFLRVERDCKVEKAEPTGRDILHCHETREKFRICTGGRVEKLAMTSIETREPLLDGSTFVATRSWEPVPPLPDAPEQNAVGPSRAHRESQEPSVASLRSAGHYRPWHARADDGDSMASFTAGPAAAASSSDTSCPLRGCNDVRLNSSVDKAVGDILTFADEMQRELGQHGQQLLRRGEEQQRRHGVLSWLFGARGGGDGRGA